MNRGKHTEYELYIRKEIARNLRGLTSERGWTQKQLADNSNIPDSTISDYMNKKSLAVPGNVQKMADAFGVSKEKIDPSFGKMDEDLLLDPRIQFFVGLERELGIDLSDPNIQKMLKKAVKVMFSEE